MSNITRQRLRNLIALLRANPNGLSIVEIAQELNVTRQTIYKDIQRLSIDGIPIYEDHQLYFLDISYQTEIQLSLAQAWFMYLPLRRIVRAKLHRYPLVKSLLYQISTLFSSEMADQLVSNIPELDTEDRDQIFLELVRGWQEQHHVEVHYRKPNADRTTKLVIAPWWFEPAVWSDAFYLICGINKSGEIYEPITLKLDRIQSVKQLSTHFERPAGQEITTYIENTWGIWTSDEKTEQVILRFHNRQYQRLQETHWHPTQRISIDDDGFVIWQADIAEPKEMLPWIRGWGADVEVIEPLHIRQLIAYEAEATARLYREVSASDEDYIF